MIGLAPGVDNATQAAVRFGWRLEARRLILSHLEKDFFWEMPEGFRMPSNALLGLAEFLLLGAHGVRVTSDSSRPNRSHGRVAVAFSGGVDSTAALRLLPDPLPIYTQVATPKGMHRLDNALLAVQEVGGMAIVSNWDEIPRLYGKPAGSYGAGAWTVTSVLLADHFDIGVVADGDIIDLMYLAGPGGHGTLFNRGRPDAILERFRRAGLEYCVPCAGLSEVSTTKIAGHTAYSMGCMRGVGGQPCLNCMKCYRKEALKGRPIPSCAESENRLAKNPIPVLGALLWAYHHCGLRHPRLETYVGKDVSWVDKWYPPSIEYVPTGLRDYFLKRLEDFGIAPMESVIPVEGWDASLTT